MAVLYRRKVSSTEAREGRVMITKDRVSRFPAPGERFALRRDGRAGTGTIEAVDCECRGPERPHQHWYLAWPGLVAGAVVEIDREGDRLVATMSAPGGRVRAAR